MFQNYGGKYHKDQCWTSKNHPVKRQRSPVNVYITRAIIKYTKCAENKYNILSQTLLSKIYEIRWVVLINGVYVYALFIIHVLFRYRTTSSHACTHVPPPRTQYDPAPLCGRRILN